VNESSPQAKEPGRKGEDKKIVVQPIPRADWDVAFQQMAERGDDKLLDEHQEIATAWDYEYWQW
jgi:hypothetical protein